MKEENKLRREEGQAEADRTPEVHSFDNLAMALSQGTFTRGQALKYMGVALLGGLGAMAGIGVFTSDADAKRRRKKKRGAGTSSQSSSPASPQSPPGLPPSPPGSPPSPPPSGLCPAGTPSMTACGSTSGCQCLYLNGNPNGTLVCAAGQGQGGTLCATNGTPLPGVSCPTGQVCAGGGGGNGRCRASCS